MTDYQTYIAKSKYARWDNTKKRRETWEETVDRYCDYWESKFPWLKENEDFQKARLSKKNLQVMGSMRAVATAGEALDRDNVAGYNCSYVAVGDHTKHLELYHEELDEPFIMGLTSPIAWDEAMYILLCGAGVGFSVERQFINNLPKVGKKLNRRVYTRNNKNYPGVNKEELSFIDKKQNVIYVADSKYGWASATRILIIELYNGNFDIKWDTSKVRPAGSILKTFGGRSSGPEPLCELFSFTKKIFREARGRKLNSIECHDIMCKIADIVVVGGVRRSALISLSNLTDERMRHAKSGAWWDKNIQRALANNSVCYTEKPDIGVFMREWEALYESKSGERGIFSREASKKIASKNGRRDSSYEFGTNP